MTMLIFAVLMLQIEPSVVAFEPGSGRFGDQLISYVKALWISYQTGLPLLLSEISFGDQLMLSTKHSPNRGQQREIVRRVCCNTDIFPTIRKDHLYLTAYHPDFDHEASGGTPSYVVVDWEDPEFIALAREHIAPKEEMPILSLPQDRITVAMHVRRGGGYDDAQGSRPTLSAPMKFPPDQFYLDALREISALLDSPPLYVHIFTDVVQPEQIAHFYAKQLEDVNVIFGYRTEGNRHDRHVLEDFFAMRQFDCLIYPLSNYSYIPSRIWDYKVRVGPRQLVVEDRQPVITGLHIEVDL